MFKKIDITELNDNFFSKIGNEWMLVTAGDKDKFNTMTASWGGVGVLWNTDVAFTFIRDSRYTIEFMDNSEYYTLSFFNGKFMKELAFCGTNSGRDVDKISATGFTPVHDENITYFEQAELVLVCKKVYKQKMTPECFIDKSILDKTYPTKDWHEMFVGKIVSVLKKV